MGIANLSDWIFLDFSKLAEFLVKLKTLTKETFLKKKKITESGAEFSYEA